MRARGPLASAIIAAALFAIPREASAEPMDPALERLVLNPGCHQVDIQGSIANFGEWNPIGGAGSDGRCLPDNAAFKRLVNQYGFTLAPTAMHAARTTGYGGFDLSLEGSFTSLDSDSDYLKYGTRGTVDASSKKASIRNNSPDKLGQAYYLKARKGFPFGLEITGVLGYMGHTSFMVIGSDVRMSLLEGFRQGVLGVLPDLAAGAGVRTVTGTPQLQLTVLGIDGQISKPLALADSSVLTPYVGYQWIRIFGDSGLIDTTPNTDPVGLCGYQGPNIPGTPGTPVNTAGGQKAWDGQPVCNGGTPLDFNNTFVFDAVRLTRHRLILGAQYRYEMVALGLQYLTDLTDPAAANGDDKDLRGIPRQYTFSVQLGAVF
jgi:hypothetical protein